VKFGKLNPKKSNNMKIKSLILFLGIFGAFIFNQAQAQQRKADDVLGIWLNQDGDAHVEMFKKNGKIYGKLVWLKFPTDDETGKAKLDKRNPDNKLKSRPVMGLEILTNFSFDGSSEWTGGEIYDPKTGKTYSCYMTFDSDNKLKIRGYIGISLIGRTTYWTRIK
jgi:uncharacterized protein (DUF2147 family)